MSTTKPKPPAQPQPTWPSDWPEQPPAAGGGVPGAGAGQGQWPSDWPDDWKQKWQELQQQAAGGGWPSVDFGSGGVPGGVNPLAFGNTAGSGQIPNFGLFAPGAGGQQPQSSGSSSPGQAAVLADHRVSPIGMAELLAAVAVALVGGMLARTWAGRPRARRSSR